MNDFYNTDFEIKSISLACYVPLGSGTAIHHKRQDYGFAFCIEEEKTYVFDNNKTIFVPKNGIIFMPKGSNYIVNTKQSGGCYAINFELFNDIEIEPFGIRIKNSPAFIESFKQAEYAWRTKKIGYHEKCKSELYNIIYSIKSEYYAKYMPKAGLK